MSGPGVGCGAAIVDDDGRLLLIKRKRPPEAGRWNLPGGKVDLGETIADAVKREIREEVGLDIELIELIAVVELIGVDGQHWIAPTYLARALGGRAQNCEPEKAEALSWAELDDPPAPLAKAAGEALAWLKARRAGQI